MPRIKTNSDGAVWDPNDDFEEYIEEQTRVCSNSEKPIGCVKGPDPQPLSDFRMGPHGKRNWTCKACFVRSRYGHGIDGDPANVKETVVTKKISLHGNSVAFREMIKNANEGRDVIKTKAPSVD